VGQNRARLAGGRLFGLHHELDRRVKTETAAYNVINYGGMLADEGRTSSYDRALRANVRPGAVVLDLGAGHGTMAFLALRAGAAKVYAIEPGEVIELGRQLAADNGFSNSIEFIQAMSTDVDLPEQVDGIVTDLRGRSPLYLKSIVSILDARDRFLKPEGWIIPASDTIWAAPASSTTIHDKFIAIWDNEYQLNFDRARLQAANTPGGVRLRPEDLLAAPQCFAVLDYKHLKDVSAASRCAGSSTAARAPTVFAPGSIAKPPRGWGFPTHRCPASNTFTSNCSFHGPKPLIWRRAIRSRFASAPTLSRRITCGRGGRGSSAASV